MNEHASEIADHTQAGHRTRLRKRLLDGGPQGFHDYELLEYLLTLTIPRVDTKPLAKRLIHDFGGIGPLLSRPAQTHFGEGLTDPTIAALKIAQATALRLLETRMEEQPVLSSWEALGEYLHAAMAHSRVEEVRILFLNARNMLIANEALWQGSVDEASVHVREVIARAIALGATALIIVHNHPSGDPAPSQQDIRLTRDLVEAGRAHESDRARSCHRRRARPDKHESNGTDLKRGGGSASRLSHGSPLFPPRDDRDLVSRKPLSDLVADRGLRRRGDGQYRDDPGRRRQDDPRRL